jgi:hypothetical protein
LVDFYKEKSISIKIEKKAPKGSINPPGAFIWASSEKPIS